jgi:nucleotide-binding universal stress UspA family protein
MDISLRGMFENVVVGVKELEAGRDALRLALALTSFDRHLTLAYVQVAAPKPAPDSGAAGCATKRRDALERLAALREESQLDAEVVYYAEARDLRHGLHDVARDRNADLLVISASREDEIYRDLVGDEAREVLDDPPCAVAVAPVGYCHHRAPLRTIGVAYNRAADSDDALAVARELALDGHARLSAFHAVTGLHLRDPEDFKNNMDDEAAQARERLERLGGLEAHAAYGEPSDELRRYADSVDLLVLGTHKRGPVGHLLGNGTARQLADAPPCPLLVVPAQARKTSRGAGTR